DHQIPKHSILSLTLVMFKGNSSGEVRGQRPLEVKGRVCYSQPTEETNKYRLGVCFTELPAEYKERLSDFLTVPA
ncbi:MAG: PilZ domain-containing protein, partial [Candidatus Omnitrophota bacterium]